VTACFTAAVIVAASAGMLEVGSSAVNVVAFVLVAVTTHVSIEVITAVIDVEEVIAAVSAITAVTEADDIAAVGPEADKDGGVAVAEVSVTTAVIDVEVNTAGGTEVDKDAGIEVIGAVIDVDETTALVTGVFVGTTGAAIAGIFGAGVAPDGAVVKAGVTGTGAAVWLPFALILENKS